MSPAKRQHIQLLPPYATTSCTDNTKNSTFLNTCTHCSIKPRLLQRGALALSVHTTPGTAAASRGHLSSPWSQLLAPVGRRKVPDTTTRTTRQEARSKSSTVVVGVPSCGGSSTLTSSIPASSFAADSRHRQGPHRDVRLHNTSAFCCHPSSSSSSRTTPCTNTSRFPGFPVRR
jgi:hypothetical protein